MDITDAAVLRAVAHPLRRRMLDVLRVDGPQNATLLSRATGQAVANASHHLKVLAEAGLVEPAPELATDARERWWRIAARQLRWNSNAFREDAAGEALADAAESLGLSRQVELVQAWLGSPAAQGEPWGQAAMSSDWWLRLSPDELSELSEELLALVARYEGRPERADREPVFFLARGFPARP